jgi:hypothetical protein
VGLAGCSARVRPRCGTLPLLLRGRRGDSVRLRAEPAARAWTDVQHDRGSGRRLLGFPARRAGYGDPRCRRRAPRSESRRVLRGQGRVFRVGRRNRAAHGGDIATASDFQLGTDSRTCPSRLDRTARGLELFLPRDGALCTRRDGPHVGARVGARHRSRRRCGLPDPRAHRWLRVRSSADRSVHGCCRSQASRADGATHRPSVRSAVLRLQHLAAFVFWRSVADAASVQDPLQTHSVIASRRQGSEIHLRAAVRRAHWMAGCCCARGGGSARHAVQGSNAGTGDRHGRPALLRRPGRRLDVRLQILRSGVPADVRHRGQRCRGARKMGFPPSPGRRGWKRPVVRDHRRAFLSGVSRAFYPSCSI